MTTSDHLYPNLYVILVGHPGRGKTRSIMKGRAFLEQLQDLHIAPTSMKMASLVDSLLSSKRVIIRKHPLEPLEFNSMALMMDEWTAFMHAYDDELVGGLTTFYDVTVPYEQWRRAKDLKIKIEQPQLVILAGSTPTNLLRFMPDFAWDQGFTSRIILIFNNERHEVDDFAIPFRELPSPMLNDLHLINGLVGEFHVTEGYKKAVAAWRSGDEEPKPTHPKLLHYNTRRRAHVYKLSMVAAVDRSNELSLLDEDFRRALFWLREAEEAMPSIFEEGLSSPDARAMSDLVDWVARQKDGVPEHRLMHQTTKFVSTYNVQKTIELLELSGRLQKGDDGLWYATDLPQ